MIRFFCSFTQTTIKIPLKFPAFTFNKPKGWSISASTTEANLAAFIMRWGDHLNFVIPQGGSETFYSYSREDYYMTNSYRPGIKKFEWFKAGL